VQAGRVDVYYGAADTVVALASVRWGEVVDYIQRVSDDATPTPKSRLGLSL
jgi:predicted GH43/DUF377 family glycosyl hydrolase